MTRVSASAVVLAVIAVQTRAVPPSVDPPGRHEALVRPASPPPSGATALARGARPSPAASAVQPACGSCHTLPPATGAHARHVETSNAKPLECPSCHATEDFEATHGNGEVDVTFAAEAGGNAARSTEGCANIYCHSDGRGRYRNPAWAGPKATCISCHDDESVASVRLSGRHVQHLRIGVGCADCHGAVVKPDKSIRAPDLHVNGRVDVRVLGGRYTDGICQPACHELRSW
jgi:predicted CxxxxCH...CXXCH cytochrome family protein